jgi:hypothetical protein
LFRRVRSAVAFASVVAAEVRWAFTPPRHWLSGVAANFVLALVWLLVEPLHQHRHQDWVILVGTYFSSFILSDVTTTNLLGVDHIRVGKALRDGTSLWRTLVVKNLALVVIVGLPTLAVAAGLTLWLEKPARLAVTIPNVAVPIVSWLGIGNLVSVLLPVATAPLIVRWRQRQRIGITSVWLSHIVLPYALYYVADPTGGIEHRFLWRELPAAIGPMLGRESRGIVHIGIALGVWVVCTVLAQVIVSRYGLRVIDADASGGLRRRPAEVGVSPGPGC